MKIPQIGAADTFCILTFGCKVNQYEAQAVREAWTSCGLVEVDEPASADVIVVNSCAVTATAVSDMRQAVRRLCREAPQAIVLLTGCAVATQNADAGTPLNALPGVAALIPPADKARLLTLFAASDTGEETSEPAGVQKKTSLSQYPPFSINNFRRSRPVLKVQDGCSQGCAYCIVPLARGASRSRPPAEAVAEARRLLEAGFREIMISGINLRQYSCRKEGYRDFWDLLTLLERELTPEWGGQARFRLSSVEPGQLDARGLDTLASSQLVCPHVHISLQSGSRGVLERMRRGHYGPDDVLRAVEGLQGMWPRLGLGADILMGFPGETEAEAAETEALVAALPLTYAHVFPYSERPGTVAANMSGSVPPTARKARAARIRALVETKRQRFWQSLLGQTCVVALEANGHGVNEWYVPCRLEPVSPSLHGLAAGCVARVEQDGLVVNAKMY